MYVKNKIIQIVVLERLGYFSPKTGHTLKVVTIPSFFLDIIFGIRSELRVMFYPWNLSFNQFKVFFFLFTHPKCSQITLYSPKASSPFYYQNRKYICSCIPFKDILPQISSFEFWIYLKNQKLRDLFKLIGA